MSFWSEHDHAVALLELLVRGELRHRKRQHAAWTELSSLGWGRRATRAKVLLLDPRVREEVAETLDRAWPSWRQEAVRLEHNGLDPTPKGIARLAQLDRITAAEEADLPDRMNRRTAAALVGRHAKSRLGPFERVVLDDVDLTDDGLVRVRPSRGLHVVKGGEVYEARALADLLGELLLTDRGLRDGARLGGVPPRAVLTVENLGTFQDAAVPEDVLVLHVPGWNTRIARVVLQELGEVPVVHFGDLDPNGVAIVEHLRRWRPGIGWLVPDFWQEFIETRGQRKQWPETALPADAPEWVSELVEQGLWLEQETVILDGRWAAALEAALPLPEAGSPTRC